VNRYAQAVMLFLLGGAVIRAGFTGLYLRYVKAGLRPLLLGAGIVLIVSAFVTVWYELRRRRTSQERADHAHREPGISWLLALPLLALILIAPPALGSYSAGHTGTVLPRPPGFPTLPAGDPLPLTVADYAGRAVYDHGRSLGDRRIKITGFIALDRGGAFYLTRMVLNCCAADAQPVKVGLSGQVPPVMQPDTWFDVIGTYTGKQAKDPVNGGVIPYINVSQARPVPAPHDPYES
jgi:uncharacterized repeat protein (TIGR03943 family)